MKLLEATGWKSFPAGGEDFPSNFMSAWTTLASRGVKELELTEKQMNTFLVCFTTQITAETDIKSGDFYFWGIHITKINSIIPHTYTKEELEEARERF